MSVIIRLQGLPWSANALDIRRYFQGLGIPEGGVHIVGGNDGDAFIAFSTDEDARQAMLIDTGRIKDARVKLMLSSRTEMQKVIEAARNRNLMLQGIMPANGAMGASPSAPASVTIPSGNMGSVMGMSSVQNPAHMMQHNDIQSQQLNMASQQMAYGNRMGMPMHSQMPQQQQQVQTVASMQQFPPMSHQSMDFANPMDMRSGKHQMMEMNMMAPMDMQNASLPDQVMLSESTKKSSTSDRDRRDRDKDRERTRDDRDRDRDRDRDQKTRRRDRSRSPRRRSSREREQRDRDRYRDREPQRSSSHGRAMEPTNNITDSGNRVQGVDRQFGDNTTMGRDSFPKDIDSRRGGPDDMMGMRMPVEESPSRHPNTMMSSRLPFENGRNNMNKDKGDSSMGAPDREPIGRTTAGGRISRWDDGNDGFNKYPTLDNRMGDRNMNSEMGGTRNMSSDMGGTRNMSSDMGGNRSMNSEMGGNRSMISEMGGSRNMNSEMGGNRNMNSEMGGNRNMNSEMGGNRGMNSEMGGNRNLNSEVGGNPNWDRGRRPIDGPPMPNQPGEFDGGSNIDGRRSSAPFSSGGPRGGSCVTIQGLNFNVLPVQIRDFFIGLSIPAEGIVLPLDERGRRLPGAFVRFSNERDRELALNRPGKQFLGDAMVEIVPCTDEKFLEAERSVNNQSSPSRRPFEEPRKNVSDTCILLKGLPYSCREGDVVRFFENYNLSDVIVEYDNRGRAIGTGFVEFANAADAKQALGLTGRKIGHRYIDLLASTKESMETARMHSGDLPNIRGGDSRSNRGFSDGPFKDNFDRDQPMFDCCKVMGLPLDAKDRDILDFFSPMQVLPVAIHMMLDNNGQPSGMAFCEFANPHDCKQAVQQNGAPMHPGSRFHLHVKPVPRREIENTLGSLAAPSLQAGHPRGDEGTMNSPPSRSSEPFRAQNSNMPPNQPFNQGPPPGRPFQDRHPGDRRGPSPSMNRGPMRPGPGNHVTVDSFGRPGCVVEAVNLPYRSSVEDILDFFQGFSLTKDCVIRRFNEKGMPTGDARISFQCPEDAQAAIRQLDKTSLYGRNVALHLV